MAKIARENVYEVYTHKGNIIARRGNLCYNGIFYPEGLKTWHCGFRTERGLPKPLTLYGRKVWCEKEEDIPKAVEILMNRINRYQEEVKERADKMQLQEKKVIKKYDS